MNRIQVTSTYLTSVLYVQTRIQHWSLTAGNLGLSNSTGSGPAMFLGERAEKKVLYEGKATATSTSNSERRNVVITTLGGLLRELLDTYSCLALCPLEFVCVVGFGVVTSLFYHDPGVTLGLNTRIFPLVSWN